MNKTTLGIITGIFIGAFGVLLYNFNTTTSTTQNTQATKPNQNSQEILDLDLNPINNEEKIQEPVVKNEQELAANPQIYKNENLGFEITRAVGFKPTEVGPNSIAFQFTGASQKQNTELFDGASVTITILNKNNQNLQSIAENNLQQDIGAVNSTVTKRLQQTTLNEYTAYNYKYVGAYNEIEVYIVSLDELDKYAKISVVAVDPAANGYKKSINQMLTTFVLL